MEQKTDLQLFTIEAAKPIIEAGQFDRIRRGKKPEAFATSVVVLPDGSLAVKWADIGPAWCTYGPCGVSGFSTLCIAPEKPKPVVWWANIYSDHQIGSARESRAKINQLAVSGRLAVLRLEYPDDGSLPTVTVEAP